MNFGKSFLYNTFFLLISFQTVFAVNPKGTVNVLTWWDYLRPTEIASIVKEKCGVTLYYDEYYCNSEFLKRFPSNKLFYDIIIFPKTVYALIKDSIEINKSTLNKVTENYDSCIRNHYLSHNYPKNIAFFTISLVGFIWNPENITLSIHDTNFSMFKKSKDGIVVMANDPVSVDSLINNRLSNNSTNSKENFFKQTAQDTTVYITNGYNKLYDNSKFAFAFQRSGDAVFAIKASKKPLHFLIHPNFSYISPDLLAELNTRSETQCTARVLASKEVAEIVQKKSYFLSPYGTYKSVNDPIFQSIYKQLHNICSSMRWLESISVDSYKSFLKKWDDIAILPQILRSNTTFPRPEF